MSSGGHSRHTQLAGIRVLLVEDNHVNRLVARAILERAGVTVVVARNGLEALDRVERDRPFDAVLMDVQMPELDGYDATRRIRQTRGLERLPVIAMTAQAAPEEREACLAAGMNAHVSKPIDADELLSVLAAAVAPAGAGTADGGTQRAAPQADPPSGGLEDAARGESGADPTARASRRRSLTLPGVNVGAALSRLGGNSDLLLTLLHAFTADAVTAAAGMRRALAASDLEETRRLAHLLMGEAGNVSADHVFRVARAIGNAARDGDQLIAFELLSTLDREVERILVGLPVASASPVRPVPAARAPAPGPPPPGDTGPAPIAATADLPAHSGVPPAECRPTVLIVDDSEVNAQALGTVLSDMCDIFVGTSGYEALSLAASRAPDLILLDVMMPGMDGYQVCAQLKADSATAQTPVIFVTAKDDAEDEARGLELGAIDYITKPLKAPIVRARVRNHLELKRYRDILENLSIKDALTGVANRRRLDESLSHEWRRALRSLSPLSYILVDIDAFKAYNDNYGHPAGDECLRRVSRALAGATRRFTDLVARYGGDEFACVLPITDRHGASILGNRLRATVEALKMPHGHSPVANCVTVSVGVATLVPTGAIPLSALTETADRHLYEAKRAGRNRVVTD